MPPLFLILGDVMVEIALDISRHCIESEFKYLYEKKVREYFRKRRDRGVLEKEIELISYLLNKVDFPSLRNYLSLLDREVGIQRISLIGGSGEKPYLHLCPLRDKNKEKEPLKVYLSQFFLS